MTNQKPFVVFHSSPDVDIAKQSALREAVFKDFPAAVSFFNPSDKNLAGHRMSSAFINASEPDALQTVLRESKGQKIAFVTLSQQWMKAASDHGMSIITLVPPEFSVGRCHVAAAPNYVPDAVRKVVFQR